jgi:1-acyl-sn-glycerol-3-phosphate acyltransferase
VPVQPCALAYVDREGGWHAAVDYLGETTFVDSIFRIIGGEPIVARLGCLAPIPAEGAHRRELARAAHDAIAGALGIAEQNQVDA